MALKPLNSVGGFSVGEIPANVILANADFVSNNITVQKIANLGPIGNVIITGGSANQYLQTDGFGSLTFTTADTSRILNGTSNVSIPAANGNVNTSVGGTPNVFVVTISGANVTGTLNASGNLDAANANLGNLVTANFANFSNDVVVQGNIANANNISVTNNLNAVIGNFSGNITSLNANLGNLATANFVNVASNLTVNLELSGNIANFSGNITSLNANLGNLVTANFANFTNDVVVQGNIANANNISVTNLLSANTANFSGNVVLPNLTVNLELAGNTANFTGNLAANGVLTDNLYHANGTPWDFQQPAGSNTEIQFNDGAGGFGASNNFTFNTATNVLTVTGNANVTNTLLTPNVDSGSSNLTLTANGFNTVYDTTGNVTFPANGTVTVGTLIGNVQANINITAPNTTILFSDAGLVDGSNSFTFNKLSNLVSISGNLALGLSGENQIVNNSNTALEIRGGWNANTNTAVNIVAGDYNNSNNWGKLAILGNVSGNSVGYSEANAFVFTNPGSGLGNMVKVDILNPAATSTTTGVIQANGGIGVTGNGHFGGDVVVTGNIANANNISATNYLYANNANVTANLTAGNANLGNLAQANFVNVSSNLHTVNANVTGTLEVANANIASNLTVNNLTINLELSGNTANLIGNVVLSGAQVTVNNHIAGNTANFSGNITASNANLGNLADANFVRSQELFNGNSNVRIAANGNVTFSATGLGDILTISSVGANIVGYVTANGDGTFGAVKSNTVTAQGGNLSLYSEQVGNTYIQLRPYGSGTVDVGNVRITSLATPNASTDAATKQYVDDVAQGLNVHDSCLAATGNTLANLTGGTITYNNGTSGVGANLVLSGSPTLNYLSANVFDGNVTAVVGSRILVKDETNGAYNGIYVVDSSTVLTRASDYNTVPEVEAGDFVFVQDGTTYNDTGWVQTSVVATIGTDPILFTQFSGAGTYQAGQGLTLTGTVFSVNVDNITTEISGGNVIVKANAQFTTPNIGAATGTSVDLTGNVLAGNVNSNAKVTAIDFEASGNVLANNISANANLTSNNATVNLSLTGNTANFSGNVVVPNLTVNLELAGNTANFTGNLTSQNANLGNLASANYVNVANIITTQDANVTGTLTVANANFAGNITVNNLAVNLELGGNTANFSGNVVLPNLTVNLQLAGNTANFTGNLVAANLATAGTANVAVLNVSGNVTSDLLPNANLTHDLGNSSFRWDNVYAGNIDASGNLSIGGNLSSNNYTANIITANNYINIGNTAIRQGQVTTSSITANQAISTVSISGITGIEWVVKGLDSAGSGKYSMAIVTAVTDGTTVDYSTFGGVNLGSSTGSLAVNVVGSNIELQVTPTSSNSTVWVTQYRTI